MNAEDVHQRPDKPHIEHGLYEYWEAKSARCFLFIDCAVDDFNSSYLYASMFNLLVNRRVQFDNKRPSSSHVKSDENSSH